MKRGIWRALAAATMILAAAGPGHAQDWPTKPLRLIVPFGPAGAADLLGRILAEHLPADLKQNVVVENRGGAAGLVGSALAARAEPDGYTLLISGLAPQVIAPLTNPDNGIDPVRDFTHIAYLGGPPIGWIVAPSSEIRSVGDVVRLGRDGKVPGYASSGTGTLGHLVGEFIVQKSGVKLSHIPYNTAVMTDLIAGRVPVASYAWSSITGQVQGGAVRAVAVTTEARLPDYPDVPTMKEQGYDLVANTWFALSGPKGLPQPIVQRLHAAVARIMALPDVVKRIEQQAFVYKPMSPDELTRHFEADIRLWKPVVQAAGLKAQ
jgi:tripartite-type tricarboxylate transporter receptor subunit TctC